MANINKPYTFAPNTTISSSQMNADMDTLYTEFNGAITSANLASRGITTSKITDANVTTAKFATGAVTPAKLNADAVTAAKIDWASTGADAGIWWEELGRTTLGSNGDTIAVSTFTAKKYLMILAYCIPTGGTINLSLRFNGDSGNNYSNRASDNGAADGTTVSNSSTTFHASAAASRQFGFADVLNVATQTKLVSSMHIHNNTTGAASAPSRSERASKWVNTTDSITSLSIINTSGTGDYATGSEVVVLGHD